MIGAAAVMAGAVAGTPMGAVVAAPMEAAAVAVGARVPGVEVVVAVALARVGV